MTTLTRCQQVTAWLTDAQSKRHAVIVGGGVTRLTHADKTIEFSSSKLGDLDRYIAALQCEYDACNGRAPCRGRAFRIQPSGW